MKKTFLVCLACLAMSLIFVTISFAGNWEIGDNGKVVQTNNQGWVVNTLNTAGTGNVDVHEENGFIYVLRSNDLVQIYESNGFPKGSFFKNKDKWWIK